MKNPLFLKSLAVKGLKINKFIHNRRPKRNNI